MLAGQNGNDVLYSGAGADSLYGQGGADTLMGGAGRDVLDGGGQAGDVFRGVRPVDTVVGGAAPGGGDRTPPDTTVSGGRPAETEATEATFLLSASEDQVTFECSLDGAAFAACPREVSYTGLAVGQHTFRASATDGAGNTDPTPAAHTWTVLPSEQGSSSWTDPVGDQNPGGPDITNVTVGDYAGKLTIRVEIPNFEQLPRNVLVNVDLDVDRNPATGSTYGGHEYLISASRLAGDPVTTSLLRWDGAAWESLDSRPAIEWSFGPTFALDLDDIGRPQAFDFSVRVWGDDTGPGNTAPQLGRRFPSLWQNLDIPDRDVNHWPAALDGRLRHHLHAVSRPRRSGHDRRGRRVRPARRCRGDPQRVVPAGGGRPGAGG